jgi:rubrerythrin
VVSELSTGTRRGLLRSSAIGLAAAGGVGLAGCGSAEHRRRQRPPTAAREQDADLLNWALAAEQHAIAAYTAVTPMLSGVAGRAAGVFLAHDLDHAGELRRLLDEIGGTAHQPASSYPFGPLNEPAAMLELLAALERAQIDAYLAAIPRLSTARLREVSASLLAADAQHSAVLRVELGIAPLADLTLPAAA